MRFGLCAPISELDKVFACGFDYIEIPLNSFAQLSDAAFLKLKKRLETSGVSNEANNFFFPMGMRLTGSQVDFQAISEYCKSALARAAALGSKLVVVGCGEQRSAPDGFSRDTAVKQFGGHLMVIADLAQTYGITVTIESIRPGSSNILNTLTECQDLMHELAHPNILLMADFAQICSAHEPLDDIAIAGGALRHAHICNSTNTMCPWSREEDNYDAFFSVLAAGGFQGNMTVETHNYQPETLSTKLLRELAIAYHL